MMTGHEKGALLALMAQCEALNAKYRALLSCHEALVYMVADANIDSPNAATREPGETLVSRQAHVNARIRSVATEIRRLLEP